MHKALVIGEDTRSFLSVVRSLGSDGYHVDVLCFDRTSPSLASKYIGNAYYFNYQSFTQADWLYEVIALNKKNAYDIIIPCDERAIFPLSENKDKFSTQTKLAIPNAEVLEHLFDKSKTKSLAQTCDVRVAKGDTHPIKQLGYQALSRLYSSKFVVKPTFSFASDNLAVRQKVAIVSNQSEFDVYTKYIKDDDLFLVEEFFTGVGEGLSILAYYGKIQYAFAHTRVNEPRAGGGSSYRKSIDIDDSMLKACERICQATQYHGVGMFEFKKNYAKNEWILVEVNARFWGSLPLAVYAGIDFPAKYAGLLIGKTEPHVSINQTYRRDAFARSLSADLFDIKAEFEFDKHHHSLIQALKNLSSRLFAFRRLLTRETIDSYCKDDKAPFYEEARQFYSSTFAEKLNQNTVDKKEKMRLMLRCLYRSEQPSIKFVCYGNIMRSPMAMATLRLLCEQVNLDWKIESFGFHQNERRRSPQECIGAAAKLGIDLSAHRSRCLRQTDIEEEDIIIVFDKKNINRVESSYQVKHLFNLADFVPSGLGSYKEIEDPYGKGSKATAQCYLLVVEACKHIFEEYLALTRT